MKEVKLAKCLVKEKKVIVNRTNNFDCLMTSDRGVSILELALVLPLLLIFIAGFVEVALRVNHLKSAAEASKEAARMASAQSRASSVSCGTSKDLYVECKATDETVLTNDSVQLVGEKSVCNYIRNAGFGISSWKVRSEVKEREDDGVKFQLSEVEVKENTGNCIFCVSRFFSEFAVSSVSNFILEGKCK